MATDFLSDKQIQALKPETDQGKHSDGSGMYLLVTPTGGKLWQFAYRFGGKQKTLSIGKYPAVPLAIARKIRNEAREKLARGIDPHAEKMEKKAKTARVAAAEKVFTEIADAWLHRQRAQGLRPKTIDGYANCARHLKGRFGKLQLKEIKREDVLTFLQEFEEREEIHTLGRVRTTGEMIYDYASDDDVNNPFRAWKRGKFLYRKAVSRAAMTRPEDAARLFKLLAADRLETKVNHIVTLALRLIALTAVRPGELAGARWAEIDFGRALWIIPGSRMKQGKEHWVPLSRQALTILRALHEMTGKDTFVFATKPNKPIWVTTLNCRLRFLGIEKHMHTSHGFRSTFSTLLRSETDMHENKMWDRDLIEMQLAHIEGGVAGIYNRGGPDEWLGARRKLMQAWADRIDAFVNSGAPVPLRKQEIACKREEGALQSAARFPLP